MLLKFRTYSAHPDYGTAKPGQVVNVPDHLGKALIDGKYADAVTRESTAVSGGETAMQSETTKKGRGESR